MPRKYVLMGEHGPYPSIVPGKFGGHRKQKIYGRLDCPAALRAIARGGYVDNRVFFQDERSAIACGYCPCAVCLPVEYRSWKKRKQAVEIENKTRRSVAGSLDRPSNQD